MGLLSALERKLPTRLTIFLNCEKCVLKRSNFSKQSEEKTRSERYQNKIYFKVRGEQSNKVNFIKINISLFFSILAFFKNQYRILNFSILQFQMPIEKKSESQKLSSAILPRDHYNFNKWRKGDPIELSHCRIIFRNLGKDYKALFMLKTGLRENGTSSINTFAQIAGYENLAEAIGEANERNNGEPVFSEKDIDLFQIKNGRSTIECLSRENILKLLKTQE